MTAPLSDKAIAQAFREAFDTPTRDPREYAPLFRINQRARELDAATIHSCSPYCERPECVRERVEVGRDK